uniref:Band 7 domain-containing protein n=1 Tax=Panagrolaimus sp. PS1159 TaxID=55785 RepID=A0AC35GBM1_9BILA
MVVFRLGKLYMNKPLGPGIVIILPCVDSYTVVDLRTMSYDVPSQEMLTKDSVTVSVDAAIYFRTSDPIATISAAVDSILSTKQLAQTTIRNVLGTRSLSEIMSAREEIALQAQEILNPTAANWGIKLERVEVKDIKLPRELTRLADAKIVSAAGELNASFSLREAAKRFEGSPTAIQLRYLQTLTRISQQLNHTVIFHN